MEDLKWLFFDMGSTLIDESKVYEDIYCKIAETAKVSYDQVCQKALEYYQQNKKGDIEVAKLFGVERPRWNPGLETLYNDTKRVLQILSERYRIGIIANQMLGSEERLVNFGIREYLDLIVASAEEGVQKPDKRIFEIALERAGCTADQAMMIGDRIDNDIVPAKELGFKTAWIKQGPGQCWHISGEREIPDHEVHNLSELLMIL